MSVFLGALARVTVEWPLGAASAELGGFQPQESVGLDKGKGGAGAALFPQVENLTHLLEAGASVNAPPDPCEQSPVHLAAGGGRAWFLLWQLQTGADLNQQVTK